MMSSIVICIICVCGVMLYIIMNRRIRYKHAVKLRKHRKQEFEKQIESVGIRVKNEMEVQKLNEQQSKKKPLRVVKGIFAGHDELIQ